MGYKVQQLSSNGWIYIFHEDAMVEPDSFMALLKSVQAELGGKIMEVPGEWMQYRIENDPMRLVFQWDDLFGNVVIVQDLMQADDAVTLLKRHCRKLNGESP